MSELRLVQSTPEDRPEITPAPGPIVFVADATPTTAVPDTVSIDGIDPSAMRAARLMLTSVVTRTLEAAPAPPCLWFDLAFGAFDPFGVVCWSPRVLMSQTTT